MKLLKYHWFCIGVVLSKSAIAETLLNKRNLILIALELVTLER